MIRSLSKTSSHGWLKRPLNGSVIYHSRRRLDSPQHALITLRLLSTIPPAPEPDTTENSSSIPPNVRKHKVELRPGPVKTGLANSPAPAPPSPSQPKQNEVASSQVNPSESNNNMSMLDMTKRDIADAQQQGIMAPPPADAAWYAKLIHQAKELFKFYWRGLKTINANRKQVARITARVKDGGPPLSRWETRFIRTYHSDATKLIPFLIIVLVLEEVIPLIALYAPGMLPSTCILPSQQERIDIKKDAGRRASKDHYAPLLAGIAKEKNATLLRTLPNASEAYCGLLQLPTYGTSAIRLWRIKKHLQYIASDDALLLSEGSGQRLSHPEIVEALHERGIVTFGLKADEIKARLRWWLNAVSNTTTTNDIDARVLAIAQSVVTK